MKIIVRLDVMLAKRKRRAKDVAAQIGLTETTLSLLRTGKVRGVRFDTLAKLCEALECKPGDLLDVEDDASGSEEDDNVTALRGTERKRHG
ncbi:MAG: helix-turn-helix transcriptional regulator [Pseudomonadota bacterium]